MICIISQSGYFVIVSYQVEATHCDTYNFIQIYMIFYTGIYYTGIFIIYMSFEFGIDSFLVFISIIVMIGV